MSGTSKTEERFTRVDLVCECGRKFLAECRAREGAFVGRTGANCPDCGRFLSTPDEVLRLFRQGERHRFECFKPAGGCGKVWEVESLAAFSVVEDEQRCPACGKGGAGPSPRRYRGMLEGFTVLPDWGFRETGAFTGDGNAPPVYAVLRSLGVTCNICGDKWTVKPTGVMYESFEVKCPRCGQTGTLEVPPPPAV